MVLSDVPILKSVQVSTCPPHTDEGKAARHAIILCHEVHVQHSYGLSRKCSNPLAVCLFEATRRVFPVHPARLWCRRWCSCYAHVAVWLPFACRIIERSAKSRPKKYLGCQRNSRTFMSCRPYGRKQNVAIPRHGCARPAAHIPSLWPLTPR